MSRRIVFLAVVVLGVAMIGSGIASAAGKAADLTVKPGVVKGTLADTTGKVIGNTTLRVLDAQGQLVGTTMTDANGKFAVELKPGMHKLVVTESLSLMVAASEQAKVTELSLVIPGAAPYAAAAEEGGSRRGSGGWLIDWTTVGIAVGISAAVALPGIILGVIALGEADDAKNEAEDAKDEADKAKDKANDNEDRIDELEERVDELEDQVSP